MKGNNLPAGNNNFNNLLPLLSSVNLFDNIEGFNPLPNNNNNSSSKGLNSNVAALVNALTGINLIGEYYPREESFIKPTEFGGTEIEDSNKWLKDLTE